MWKQIDVGFFVTSVYPQWVANIVLVPEKDGKFRMYVDYRDLNKSSLKDGFPLPYIDMLVDNTIMFNLFSFMDDFSGYNRIKVAPEDMKKNNVYHPLRNILLQSDALRFKERWCYVLEGYTYPIP